MKNGSDTPYKMNSFTFDLVPQTAYNFYLSNIYADFSKITNFLYCAIA